MMKRSADCVIIGGGVIGCAVAYYLAAGGMDDVVLLESKSLSSGATGRCGGGIRQQWSTEANTRLAMESVRTFRSLESELEADVEFAQGGYLVLGYTQDDVAQFERNVAMQRRLGLDVETLSAEEVNDKVVRELNTSGVRLATYCPSDASANPFLVTQAYADAARRLGVSIELFTRATRVTARGGRIEGVQTPRGTVSTPRVVNAAGSHSLLLARTVGIELPIEPSRREILVTEPLDRFFDPMIISFSFGIYFRQVRHGSVIGGFADPGEPAGFNETSSLTFLTTMSRKLAHLMPALGRAKVVRQWAGLYDVTPDAQPILGPVDEIEGFYQANGFSGHGFMIAPAAAKVLAQVVRGEEPSLPIDRLNVRRFSEGKVTTDRSVV